MGNPGQEAYIHKKEEKSNSNWILRISVTTICLALVTIILRVVQVRLEPCPWVEVNQVGSRWTVIDVVGYGLMRRLDDAKFWVLLMVGVSGLWIAKAQNLIEPLDGRVQIPWRVVVTIFVVLCVAVGMLGYLDSVERRGGTFFWTPSEDTHVCVAELPAILSAFGVARKGIESPASIYWLQFAEGIICLAAIIVQGVIVWFILATPNVEDKTLATDIAKLHLRACMAVPIAGALFYAAFTILVNVLKTSHPTTASEGTGSASAPVHALGVITVVSIPYLVALAVLLTRFRRDVKLVVKANSWWGFLTVIPREDR